MSDPFIWQIENGVLAFSLVDPLEVGYLASWNGPGGVTETTATLADYEADSAFWSCQVTSGTLTPTADTTTNDVPATFCANGRTVPTPLQSTWTLDVEMLQDPHAGPTAPTMGLAEYTYLHDAQEVYGLLGLNGDLAPRAVFRVRLSPTAFGGAARTPLTASASWPVTQWPSIAWGTTLTTTARAATKREKSDA